MYALIYDEFDPAKREKEVVSIHPDRASAEKALNNRRYNLGKKIAQCHTRIVWMHKKVHTGETVTPNWFDTWAPDEEIPESEKVPDGD